MFRGLFLSACVVAAVAQASLMTPFAAEAASENEQTFSSAPDWTACPLTVLSAGIGGTSGDSPGAGGFASMGLQAPRQEFESLFAPVPSELVNIRDYGAIGDGFADDTSAIQAAVIAAGAQGTILVPRGTFLISDDIDLLNDQTFMGMGMGSFLVCMPAAAINMIHCPSDKANIRISNLYLHHIVGGTSLTTGILVEGTTTWINNVSFGALNRAIHLSGASQCYITSPQVASGRGDDPVGILFSNGAFHNELHGGIISDISGSGSADVGGVGLQMGLPDETSDCQHNTIVGATIEKSARDGVLLYNADRNQFIAVKSDNNSVETIGTYDNFALEGDASHNRFIACLSGRTDRSQEHKYGWEIGSGCIGNELIGCYDHEAYVSPINDTGGSRVIGGNIPLTAGTLEDSATPSIAGPTIWKTGGSATITDLAGGYPGLTILIMADHKITITDGTNIMLNGSTDWTMTAGDTLSLICRGDGKWYETGRGDNGK